MYRWSCCLHFRATPLTNRSINDWDGGFKTGYSTEPTIVELLKLLGYTSGHFGKNHLGDHNKHLPTNYGFAEFYGNLYHLNAEEEPETYYYPKDPAFHEKYGPRGVIRSTADGSIKHTGP